MRNIDELYFQTCMSKIRNTEITDKRGFRYNCYVATANQNLKDLRNSSLCTYDIHILWTY